MTIKILSAHDFTENMASKIRMMLTTVINKFAYMPKNDVNNIPIYPPKKFVRQINMVCLNTRIMAKYPDVFMKRSTIFLS